MPTFFDLDPHKLDEEWVNHSRIYHEHYELLVEARDTYDRAKVNLDIVTAELDHEIRLNPKLYGVEKISENVVDRTIMRQQQWQIASRELLVAKKEMGKCQAVVDALDHRKKALEKLVDLFLHNYYSEPRENRQEVYVSQKGVEERNKVFDSRKRQSQS